MDDTEIVSNSFETQNIGISLMSCKGTTAIRDNNINTTNIGINLYESEANIENNIVIGACNLDSCSKVSFNKVAEIGINTDKNSESFISNNILKNFFTSIEAENSVTDIRGNKINFTNSGIHIRNSDANVILNYINNSYYGIISSDSSLQTSGTEMNTFDIGIRSFNSSIDLEYVIMNQGRLCMYYVDSDYTISNYQNLNLI